MDLLFNPHTWPFGSALVLLVALTVIEGAGLLLGGSFSEILDHLMPDSSDGLLGWLHVGKVPLLVLMVLFLMGFSLSGFAIAGLTHNITGYWPPVILSVIPAIMFGIGCMKLLGNLIARLKITDQSTAVSELSLLGRVAIISEGNATTGMAAQAKVRDQYGQTHHILVEPDISGQTLLEGESVLLIRKAGARYTAIKNPHPEQLH